MYFQVVLKHLLDSANYEQEIHQTNVYLLGLWFRFHLNVSYQEAADEQFWSLLPTRASSLYFLKTHNTLQH
jgi:hypothetical protein